ncbi:MAG TPA: PQQ-dependent sugar dehydrogenase, partial [Methylophilaceae bacterium]|nr:PQQ-dependent sugar dehydrogenase [Methylophilaceae bacterium]
MKPDQNSVHELFSMSALATVLLIGCGTPMESRAQGENAPDVQSSRPAQCKPLETRPRETKYEPAFPGQTRICSVDSKVDFSTTVITRNLDHPWSVEPLPDGSLLVSEKPGHLRIVSQDGKISPPIEGVLPVDARGQGGLLDVALSPDFANDRT